MLFRIKAHHVLAELLYIGRIATLLIFIANEGCIKKASNLGQYYSFRNEDSLTSYSRLYLLKRKAGCYHYSSYYGFYSLVHVLLKYVGKCPWTTLLISYFLFGN